MFLGLRCGLVDFGLWLWVVVVWFGLEFGCFSVVILDCCLLFDWLLTLFALCVGCYLF